MDPIGCSDCLGPKADRQTGKHAVTAHHRKAKGVVSLSRAVLCVCCCLFRMFGCLSWSEGLGFSSQGIAPAHPDPPQDSFKRHGKKGSRASRKQRDSAEGRRDPGHLVGVPG